MVIDRLRSCSRHLASIVDSPHRPRSTRRYAVIVLAALTLFLAPFMRTGSSPGVTAAAAAPTGLHAVGNQLLDSTGTPVHLHGVNYSGTEYACIQGWGFADGPVDAATFQTIASWNANAVRIPLNEDCWLAINGAPAAYAGAAYQKFIANEVALVQGAGLVPILEIHWSGHGTTQATGQEPMLNRDHSVTAWQQIAAAYAGNTGVVLEPHNEPYPDNNSGTTAAWTCWRDGGTCSGVGYQAAGMQEIVTAIRGAGATNLILLDGVQYSNNLAQWLTYRPSDLQNNIGASWHVYNFNVCNTTTCYDSQVAPVAAQVPLVATEFGSDTCSSTWANAVMTWVENHNGGELAWTWDTWGTACSNLSLISDFNGTATQWGSIVKTHYAGLSTAPSATATPIPATATPKATATPVLPTATTVPATSTTVPATATPIPATATPSPKPSTTATSTPSPTATPSPTSTPSPTPTSGTAPTQTNSLVLYDNAIHNGFTDGSFAYKSRKACDRSTYVSATCSYAITLNAWGALSFSSAAGLDTTPYNRLEWNVNTHGQAITKFSVLLTDNTTNQDVIVEVPLQTSYTTPLANGWTHVSVPLSQLNPNNVVISEVQLKNYTARTLASINIDDVQFVR